MLYEKYSTPPAAGHGDITEKAESAITDSQRPVADIRRPRPHIAPLHCQSFPRAIPLGDSSEQAIPRLTDHHPDDETDPCLDIQVDHEIQVEEQADGWHVGHPRHLRTRSGQRGVSASPGRYRPWQGPGGRGQGGNAHREGEVANVSLGLLAEHHDDDDQRHEECEQRGQPGPRVGVEVIAGHLEHAAETQRQQNCGPNMAITVKFGRVTNDDCGE